jgi:tetratricopeptide (TPR) repeat protein
VELDALIAAATESQDWARAAELRLEKLATLTTPPQQVRELVAVARILQAELNDPEGAIEALEQARAIAPRRVPVLQALRRGYETLGRWASAIEVIGALADLAPVPTDRAALRVAQAKVTLERLEDEEGALGCLEQALLDDPANVEARAALAQIRASLTPPEPMHLQASLTPPEPMHLQAPLTPPEPMHLQASLTPPEPMHLQASLTPPEPMHLQASLTPPEPMHLQEPPPEPPPAVAEESSDALDPARYARAFAVYQSEGHSDGALLAAMALEELGAADAEQRALVERFRSVSPIRARGTLDPAAWGLLRPEGSDEVVCALLGSVARAGVLARLDELVEGDRLVVLDPKTRLDESSTASVVRTFQWAARVLGVPTLQLHALDAVPGEIAAVRGHQPATAVGPSIVSGRSAKDLAFLAGRHLTYYLPDHQALVYFPTLEELTRLLFASVQLVKPRPPTPGEGGRAVIALADLLDRHVTTGERAAILDAVRRLEARGGRFSLASWTRHTELMATRAGLLLCGDLAAAMAVMGSETRGIAGLTLEAKRRDLVAFSASQEHAELRLRWAAPATESLTPPPRSAAYPP